MSTPEGRVKDLVKKVLKSFGPGVYYHMPVQNGMGSPTLDFIGCAGGRYFGVETKAPGKLPTPRQLATIQQIRNAGGRVFVIDGPICVDYKLLRTWLMETTVTSTLAEGVSASTMSDIDREVDSWGPSA